MSTIRCAYLRVYEPLDAFTAAEQAILAGPDAPLHLRRDRYALGLVDPAETREVYQRTVEGELFVCPARNRMRTLLALLALERSLPPATFGVLFTPDEIAKARSEVASLRGASPSSPGARPHVVQSAWHVPVRWFACFDDSERILEQHGDHPTIRYETTVGVAGQRMQAALETLKGGVVHPVILGMVFELHAWLATFDERALLELDYASVAELMDPDDLADDHSAADLKQAIESLQAGDGARAARYYGRVNERWAPLRVRESLN